MTRPTVFVGGASAEAERVRWAMDAVEREGWLLALDWLEAIELEGTANGMSRSRRRSYADLDGLALRDSSIAWFLATPKTRGAWVELGLALAWGIPCVVSGADSQHCIYAAGMFDTQCLETLTDAEGLEVLKRVIDED